MLYQFNEDAFMVNLSQEAVRDLQSIDLYSLNDEDLICTGHKLHSIWEHIDELDFEIDTQLLRERMRQVYQCVLSRAQKTQSLDRLARLVPTLPYFIYSPELPREEDCFEPVDELVWSLAERVSREPNAPQWVIEAAVKALMVETEGIDMEDLMEEPVYRWAMSQMCNVSSN